MEAIAAALVGNTAPRTTSNVSPCVTPHAGMRMQFEVASNEQGHCPRTSSANILRSARLTSDTAQ